MHLRRRDFLRLAGLGGVVFVSGAAVPVGAADHDFFFVQLSDAHWGFTGRSNPDPAGTLHKAVDAVNRLSKRPDFIVFTGDLTHITHDAKERRRRFAAVRRIVGEINVPSVRYLPGEHDAALDHGQAFEEFFGARHYTFDHKGIHFIALDNVSDPAARLGAAQLRWLAADLEQLPKDTPIVVFAHRPLFDLYPKWGWATADGAEAVALLEPYPNVTVFYGHVHQLHHHFTGHIAHHSARSLMFALPAPGSQARSRPLPWNRAEPYKGLGFRSIDARVDEAHYRITEVPLADA